MRNGIKVGRHAIFELYGCNSDLLDDEEYINNSLSQVANNLGAIVLSISSYKFNPQGVTTICLLSESHISIHTWPEKQFATCDIFTCGSIVPDSGIEQLKLLFNATETNSIIFDR